MAAVATRPYYEGNAIFDDGERVDFRQASEHLRPAADFYGQREAISEAIDRAIKAYAAEGIDDAEAYANGGRISTPEISADTQRVNYLRGASKNLAAVRAYELDTHWNLEEHMPEAGQKLREMTATVIGWFTGDKTSAAKLKIPSLIHGLTERELLQRESAIGRELFGPIPEGHRREFFNLDPTKWIWYEEQEGPDGKTVSTTTRYELQDKGVLKAQDGSRYTYLEGEELARLTQAVELYYQNVLPRIYGRDAATGQKLAA